MKCNSTHYISRHSKHFRIIPDVIVAKIESSDVLLAPDQYCLVVVDAHTPHILRVHYAGYHSEVVWIYFDIKNLTR